MLLRSKPKVGNPKRIMPIPSNLGWRPSSGDIVWFRNLPRFNPSGLSVQISVIKLGGMGTAFIQMPDGTQRRVAIYLLRKEE
jgi:hypothetical protein